ncbi:MAG: glycosyltransferase [Deltaproteobacteria bacterium]|jgi:glycosyltransferase involved in cell wall biosynthesis|nr:glycosyltransferase [Deltaproteobacteria bacterium]
MGNGGLVSVIVPVYNAARYLPSLFDNLARQTFRDFELILVNDCSTDGSGEAMRSLARGMDRVRIIELGSNSGPGPARNAGLDAASGEFVAFIDADDGFSDRYLELLTGAAARDGADVAFCGTVVRTFFRDLRERIFYHAADGFYKLFPGNEALQNYFGVSRNELNIQGTPWAKIVRKSLYDRGNLRFPPIFHEDIVVTFQELSLAGRVACYNSELYYHDRTNLSSVSRTANARIIQQLHAVPALINGFASACDDPGGEIRSAAVRFYFMYFRYLYQDYYCDPYLAAHYDEVVADYHRAAPPFGLEGSEYYIYFQMLMFYLTVLRHGSGNHFAKFVEPFRGEMSRWIRDGGIEGLGPGQIEMLGRFVAARPGPRDRVKGAGRLARLLPKAARELYLLLGRVPIGRLRRAYERIVTERSGWLDERFLRETRPDLEAGGRSLPDRFVDGWREDGISPNRWLDIGRYLEAYPDARASGVNPLVDFYLSEMDKRRFF